MPNARLNRIARSLERWFGKHQRPLPWRMAYLPYHVWVSEVMAQQTRLEVVLGYFERFIERFPDVPALAAASEDEVTALWSGLGYYRRARMLREGAIDVVSRFGGELPRDVDQLISIRGIGRYTAGAIASIAFDRRAPIVDGNVARVLARVQGEEDPWTHAEALVRVCRSPRMMNQALMELGAMVCTPRNAKCMECPLRRDCVAFTTDRIHELPAPRESKAVKRLRIPLYLVTDSRGRILMRRERGPLMTAMLHLPHGNTALFDDAPLPVLSPRSIGSFHHTITTRRITFEVFAARARRRSGYEWVNPEELRDFPHPSYVTKALRLASNRS
ncbi:MAG TPA: A/G-specific adenine glycosylase [Thermoanaerobaculia bacterium]